MRCPTWVAAAIMQIGVGTDAYDEHGVAVYMNLSEYMPDVA